MIFCIKYVVLIYNFLFWLIGVGILGTSIFLYVDSHSYINFEGIADLYDAPFFVLMVLGAIMTFVGFLGCCGALRESTCLLCTYIVFCVAIGAACGGAIWWTRENGDAVRLRVKDEYRRIVKERYRDVKPGPTEFLIDQIQRDFACCGERGIADWASSNYNNRNQSLPFEAGINVGGPGDRYTVPASCCDKSLAYSECELLRKNVERGGSTGLNRIGCIDRVEQFITEKWQWLTMIGILLLGVQAFAMLFSFCLCCTIGRSNEK